MVPGPHSIRGSKCYVSPAEPIPGHEGANGIVRRHRTGVRALARSLARTALAVAAAWGSATVLATFAPGSAGASGIVPPSNPPVSAPPQVMPRCSVSPVDDTSAGCINSVLHNINYARALEGLGPLILPPNYASQPVTVQQLIITDEERGDRGLSQFAGLDAALNTAAMTGAVGNTDPVPPAGYQYYGLAGSLFSLDYTPLGADYAWMYNDGYGGTNLECTTPLSSKCWGHRDNILGNWTTTGSQTAMMGDADTSGGQYTQIFANQKNPPDPIVDPIPRRSLPPPTTSTSPNVVQVLPASSPSTAAGTPVTIEGNY